MVEVRWLEEARDDLKDIYNYISIDSKRYARHQIEKLVKRTQILKKHIRIGKVVEEINKPEIREIIKGNYRVIYRIVSENCVHILMIHHGAPDLKRRIKKE